MAVPSRPSGGRAELEQRGVEPLQREARAPLLPGPLAQRHDLQLAPGVAAVGRVEGRPARLGQRGRRRPGACPPRTGGRPPHGHARGVHADRARQPGHPDQRLEPHADREPRVVARRSPPRRTAPRRSAPSPRRTPPSAASGGPRWAPGGCARPCEKCPGATSCTVMPGSVVALNTSSHSSMSCSRPGRLRRGDVVPGRAVGLGRARPGTSSPWPSAATPGPARPGTRRRGRAPGRGPW